MKKYEITFNIPGGWYGNDPGTLAADPLSGVVTIDPAKAHPALRWLSRRAEITETFVGGTPNPGLVISYRIRQRRKAS